MTDQWTTPLTNPNPHLGNPFASHGIISSHFLSPVPGFPDYWLAYSPFREIVEARNLFWTLTHGKGILWPIPAAQHAEKARNATKQPYLLGLHLSLQNTLLAPLCLHTSEHRAIISPCSSFLALAPGRTRFSAAIGRPLTVSVFLLFWLISVSQPFFFGVAGTLQGYSSAGFRRMLGTNHVEFSGSQFWLLMAVWQLIKQSRLWHPDDRWAIFSPAKT